MNKPTVTIKTKDGMTITVTHTGKQQFSVAIDGVDAFSASSLGEAHSKAQHIARAGRAAWLERLAFAA